MTLLAISRTIVLTEKVASTKMFVSFMIFSTPTHIYAPLHINQLGSKDLNPLILRFVNNLIVSLNVLRNRQDRCHKLTSALISSSFGMNRMKVKNF